MAAGIICEYCGGLNDASLTNCSKCGAPLPPPPAPPPPQQQQRPMPPPQYRPQPVPAQRPRSTAGKGCAVVGCLALVAIVGVLIVLGIIGALVSSTTSTTPARKTPAPAHGVVNLHGSASTTTRAFEMGREWDLVWSYNCANLGHNGTFAVVTHLIGAPSQLDDRIDRIGKSDSGRMHSRRGGTYTATVTTSCHWSIKTIDHG